MKKITKLLSVILLVALCFATLTSCGETAPADGGNDEPTPSVEPTPAAKPNQVIIGTDTEANGDWGYASFGSNNATDADVIQLTDDYNTVTSNMEGDYVINDAVVESYERTEDENGNVTYTFKIKQGLVFNNGDPITAENFVAWTLFVTSKAGSECGTQTASYDMMPGGPEWHAGTASTLAGIRLLGEYEFSRTILKENAAGDTTYLPYYFDLGYAGNQCVSLNYWFGDGWTVKDDGEGCYFYNENGQEFTSENVKDAVAAAQYAVSDRVTTGPYNLVKFDKSANEITLEINPNYAGDFSGRKPNIQKVIIVKAEDETIIDNLATGGVELYSSIADGELVNAALDLIDAGSFDGNYTSYDRAGYGYFAFACDLGPAQYTEFRQAVAYLLDRNEFANTFCQGWGGVVHGPYCTAFTMYNDSKDFIAKNLNTYDFNPEKAVELLKAAGFVLNADGTDYVDGSGLVRYKEVSAEEAANYEQFCENVNGKILMPAKLNWASSEGNSVSDLLSTMLANGAATKEAGIELTQNIMTFPELLNYMYRQDLYALGGDYAVPTYNMFNLATGWNSGVYDFSYEFTTNQDYIDQGYNTTHLYDETLDKLSMDMVYGVEPGDYDTYLAKWQEFVLRYNEMLPQVPLYANIYVSVFPNTITNYVESPFWGFSRAILYADFVG